ncbi:serine/threonine protein kinase, partial [Massospora cicadina]
SRMLFLPKPNECLAHPVDILLTHPPIAREGYEVSLTESTFPRDAELTHALPPFNFLSLNEAGKSRRHTTIIPSHHKECWHALRVPLQTRYAYLNMQLTLGSGKRAHVVERHSDLRLMLAKPLNVTYSLEEHVGTNLRHENILSIVDTVTLDHQVLAISEFCTRDLLSVAQYSRPSPTRVLGLMKQLVSGVRYLHLRKIAHRDLKLENIFLAGETPKITGFACAISATCLATSESSLFSSEMIGSRPYLAPEMFNHRYDAYLVDIWALGIILVGLSTGRFPWTCTYSDANFSRYRNDPRAYLQNLGLSKPELLLALLLLVPDPNNRPNSATLVQILGLRDPVI